MNSFCMRHRARAVTRITAGAWLALAALQASATGTPPPPPPPVVPPLGLPDKGVLRLQLGTSVQANGLHAPPRFIHEPSLLTQSIGGTCALTLGGPYSLATLTATGGSGVPGRGRDSIGVVDSTSWGCGQINASGGEALTVGLGADIAAQPLIDANSFYHLELDMEVRRNAEFVLQILIDGTVSDQYRLRTGTSIVAGQGSSLPGSPDHIFNCKVYDDRDDDEDAPHCRWIVDALGKAFTLAAVTGSGSLDGGGDFRYNAYPNNTLIYLTKGEIGTLGCNSSQVPQGTKTNTIGDGVTTPQCGVSRVDPTGFGGSCSAPIAYVLRSTAGTGGKACSINKTPGDQLAASVDITFPPEPSTVLGGEALTQIQFNAAPGVLVPFTPQRCIGTLATDHNGNPTIAEVLSVPTFVPDVVTATPQKDWACILENEQDFLGTGLMQIRQRILFWGDIQFSRQ
jgi:hypothetical protein